MRWSERPKTDKGGADKQAVMCTQLLGVVVPEDPFPVLYHEFERTVYDALDV